MAKPRDRVVYSSAQGGKCPRCGRRLDRCRCAQDIAKKQTQASDGVVRVRREVKGRGGKTVTTVSGVPLAAAELRELAGELKRSCATGGALKDGVIEIQGDHRDRLVEALEARGYNVKRAGG